ncbi:hypothetical protein D5S17_28955 [Pseudonocardiaceae bacterium YIM PH 21723]|nr:hypothetical protein D5S17_28955 [Pseudonocardiaceae bacterium YIM PH 21723]
MITEPPVVRAALHYYAGTGSAADMVEGFRATTVYFQYVRRPRALVGADTARMGSWLLVWTSLERLGAWSGECDWLSTTGADVVDNILPHMRFAGVLLDLGAPHMMTIPRPVDEPAAAAAVPVLPGGSSASA